MKRRILDKLLSWKNDPDRMPLVLMGARQVGKTYTITEFGEKNFKTLHTFNFEEFPKFREIFELDFDTDRIIKELSFFSNKKIDLDNDLVFFDEIQACPKALSSLKYFREKKASLAVCAAGSLLGVTTSEESFPVGQVQFLHIRPLDFYEFLAGANLIEEEKSFLAVLKGEIRSELVHDKLWRALKDYYAVGGMPRAVLAYAKNVSSKDNPFLGVREAQQYILTSYLSDFSKHAGRINALHIRSVFENIPIQLSRAIDESVSRYRFNEISSQIKGYSRLRGPIDWLVNSGLVNKVKIANRNEFPLESFCAENIFKLYIFDVGILGTMLDLPVSKIVEEDYGISKGYFAENFVAQALLSTSNISKKLYSWAESKSEIEFIENFSDNLVPIEVKAGKRLGAKSLASFRKRYSPRLSIKLSGKPMQYEKEQNLLHVPLYFASELGKIVESTKHLFT